MGSQHSVGREAPQNHLDAVKLDQSSQQIAQSGGTEVRRGLQDEGKAQ